MAKLDTEQNIGIITVNKTTDRQVATILAEVLGFPEGSSVLRVMDLDHSIQSPGLRDKDHVGLYPDNIIVYHRDNPGSPTVSERLGTPDFTVTSLYDKSPEGRDRYLVEMGARLNPDLVDQVAGKIQEINNSKPLGSKVRDRVNNFLSDWWPPLWRVRVFSSPDFIANDQTD